jgi:hypothetical protein
MHDFRIADQGFALGRQMAEGRRIILQTYPLRIQAPTS